ncbi:retention module-containing protein, partial [Porticoccus sp. W117]|uniref:retention module-containing protein n=1 Tax=Porticoccus sp. W117 TaxID=3054777 RepID=UPI002593FBE9
METQDMNNGTSNPIGIVNGTDGGVLVAVSTGGVARDLKVGDPVFEGEALRVHSTLRIDVADIQGDLQQQVYSARNSIAFADGSIREVPPQGIANLDANSFLQMAELGPEQGQGAPTFEELMAALENGEDINELLDATAAGEQTAGSEGELGQSVRFDRVEQSVSPEAGIDPDIAFATVAATQDQDILGDAVNAIPSSQDISAQSGNDGESIAFSVASSFTDPDGQLTFSAEGLPEGLSIDPQTGVVSGTIAPDASGQNSQDYSVTITATDTGGAQVSETFTWTVTNVPPVAQSDDFSIDESTQLQGNVLADNGNGADTDGGQDSDALTVSTTPLSGPSNGTLQLNTDGSFTYTPNDGFVGTDSFTYSVSDGQGGEDSATVTIAVLDATAPVPTIVLNPVTDDNTVNAAEASGDVAISGIVGGEFNAGDTVTVTVNGNSFTGTVDGSGAFSIDVPGSDLAADSSVSATIDTADAAGNTGSASVTSSYNVDTTAPLPTIFVNSITADNVINAAEAAGTVSVSGTVAGEFNPGDIVTLVVNGTNFTGAVDNSGNFSIDVPGNTLAVDNSVEASVSTTDAAGNTGTASITQNYSVDITEPVLAISTSDADLTAGETATITFTFTEVVSGFVDGDISVSGGTLGAISTSDGGVTYTATFTPTADSDGTATIAVADDSYADADGNLGTGDSLDIEL